MSPAPKSWVRPLAIAGGIVIALIVAGWVTLRILLPPERVLALARQQLSTTLQRQVRLEDAAVSLWPPVRASLRGFAIGEPEGLARGAAFRARAIDLNLDPFALLGHRIVIRSLTLQDPALHLVLRADGSTNFDNLIAAGTPSGAAGKPAAAFDVAIQSLAIRGGDAVVDDLKARRRSVFHIESKIALALDSKGRLATSGRTTLSGYAHGPLTAATQAQLDRSLADISLGIEHRGKFDPAAKRLALEQLALALGKAQVSFSGVVDDPGPHARLRLAAKGADVQFGELLHALSAAELPALKGVSGSGTMGFDLAVDGVLGGAALPAVRGAIGVRDAAFQYPGAAASVAALNFTARLAPDSLRIVDARARVAGQPVRASLEVTRFADPLVHFQVAGRFDLAAVAPMVAPRGTELSGQAVVDVAGAGRAKDTGSLALSGGADLTNVRVASPQLPKPMEKVSGSIRFAGDRATVKGLTGSAGKSSFTLDATVDRPLAIAAKPDSIPPANVDFTLTSPNLDLAELLPPTPGPTLLPNAKGGGRVAIAHLQQQKLDVRNVNANVTFDPRTVTVPNFTLDGYGGKVSGNAKFDLTRPASPGFAVKANVDSVQADALLSAWTPAKNLMKGALSTTIDLSGAGSAPEQVLRTLTAIGLANVTRGELGPTPALAAIAKLSGVKSFEKLTFNELKLPFEVKNGKIAMRDIAIHSGSSDWKAAGLLGFDGALDYTVTALIPADQVARLGANAALAAGALADREGKIHMTFDLAGNARNPRVGLNAQALREDLAGHLGSVLGNQGQKIQQQLKLAPADTGRGAGTVNIQAAAESLKKIKGSDLLKELFGGGKKKTAPPADTSHAARDTTKH